MQLAQLPIVSVIFYLRLIISSIYCEVFTSMTDIENLLPTENELITTLENYVEAEKHRMKLIKKYAKLFREHHQRATEDVESYLSNPVNVYILVKNLTLDWQQVESLISPDIAKDCMASLTFIKNTMKFPTMEDLNGVTVGLIRLRNTYHLDISHLPTAELNAALTATDCVEFGRKSFKTGDFHQAALWFREAENKMKYKSNDLVDRSDVLEHLAFSNYKQGSIPQALETIELLLQLLPNHPKALESKKYYEYVLQNVNSSESVEEPDEQPETESELDNYHKQWRTYEALCRGDLSPSIQITSQLKCLYVNNGNPYLFLGPFKVEEVYLNPNIYIFHDVITDAEIDTIKKLATPELERAAVRISDDGNWETGSYRICKLAWLHEDDHKHVADISQRITDMTMLSVKSAEQLQVVSYGIGGQYEPHFDFATMNDVLQGGSTVFPNILASIKPKKGTAAFWYNLHESGDGDVNTFHAACPVLAGPKWICNKWLHLKYQEFVRPCSLDRYPPGRIESVLEI